MKIEGKGHIFTIGDRSPIKIESKKTKDISIFKSWVFLSIIVSCILAIIIGILFSSILYFIVSFFIFFLVILPLNPERRYFRMACSSLLFAGFYLSSSFGIKLSVPKNELIHGLIYYEQSTSIFLTISFIILSAFLFYLDQKNSNK